MTTNESLLKTLYTIKGLGGTRAICECRCGAVVTRLLTRIKKLRIKSCGCLKVEKLVKRSLIHGHTMHDKRSGAYTSWRDMRTRCLNKNNKDYHIYGGRGIKVCENWSKFENFYSDMGERPKGLTLDRIDNNRDYSPDNCRWATQKEQNRNKRTNHIIHFQGMKTTITDLAEKSGIKLATLQSRLKSGWSLERAINAPVRYKASP